MIGSACSASPPSVRVESRIRLEGTDLDDLPMKKRRERSARTALIPDPPAPRSTAQARPVLQTTDRLAASSCRVVSRRPDARIRQRLDEVRIRRARPRHAQLVRTSCPGGMRQRVLIAAAFAAELRSIVADELDRRRWMSPCRSRSPG